MHDNCKLYVYSLTDFPQILSITKCGTNKDIRLKRRLDYVRHLTKVNEGELTVDGMMNSNYLRDFAHVIHIKCK